MSADEKLRQQQRAMRILTYVNWGGIAISVPIAIGAASLFEGDDVTPLSPRGLFGILAFLVGVAWALLFYRRVRAPARTRNAVLRRLNQAALTSAYPAYLGIAVALLTGAAAVIVPFGLVAALNVTAVSRLGTRVIDAQGEGQ